MSPVPKAFAMRQSPVCILKISVAPKLPPDTSVRITEVSASRRCPHHGGVRITEVSAPCRARARRTCCRRRTLSAPAAGRATSRSPTRCSTAPSRAPETSSPTSRPPTPARRVSSGVGTEAPRGQRDMAQQARGQGPGARGQRPGARAGGQGDMAQRAKCILARVQQDRDQWHREHPLEEWIQVPAKR